MIQTENSRADSDMDAVKLQIKMIDESKNILSLGGTIFSDMLKEKEIEGRIRYLKEQKGLDVIYMWDPANMHVTFLIKSKDGKTFKAMANSKKMALTQCYVGYLGKLK